MAVTTAKYYFRFRICWCHCLQKVKVYQESKFRRIYLILRLRYNYFRLWKTNVRHIEILLPVLISTIRRNRRFSASVYRISPKKTTKTTNYSNAANITIKTHRHRQTIITVSKWIGSKLVLSKMFLNVVKGTVHSFLTVGSWGPAVNVTRLASSVVLTAVTAYWRRWTKSPSCKYFLCCHTAHKILTYSIWPNSNICWCICIMTIRFLFLSVLITRNLAVLHLLTASN